MKTTKNSDSACSGSGNEEEIAAALRQEGISSVDGDAQEDVVPTYTIRADSWFGIYAIIAITAMAVEKHLPEAAELKLVLRQFDLYEENHRPAIV